MKVAIRSFLESDSKIQVLIPQPEGSPADDERPGSPVTGPLPTGPFGVLSGSFHPLHAGHLKMVSAAHRILDAPILFELSVENVDKAPLTEEEVVRRVAQFVPPHRLVLTRAATFLEKSALMPRTTFVVGADTIIRVGDVSYYADAASRDAAIREISGAGCRFLVAGRLIGDRYQALEDLELPRALVEISDSIAQTDFRVDISSSEIRSNTTP